MTTIILLHADGYGKGYGPSGFESVRFPVRVQAEAYSYGEGNRFTLDTLMEVPNSELTRIGYTGPLLECGHLSFGQCDHSWREPSPFDHWNALKASRDVGSLPAL